MSAPAPSTYSSAAYAQSLRHIGEPLLLAGCGGWVLERPIAGHPGFDATGCYPMFDCRDWRRLGDDLQDLARRQLVSLTMVAEPFAELPAGLRDHFVVMRPFKSHFVADLKLSASRIASTHHRYEARRALRRIEVDLRWRPVEWLHEWTVLYAQLVLRHRIHGPRHFPSESFRRLFALDGVCLMRAIHAGVTVGAQIIVLHGDVAHAHLAAFTADGYRLGASYALDWLAIETLGRQVRWIDWGGQAGIGSGGDDGLARYKRGWASERRSAWLLGAVLDRSAYARLAALHPPADEYFPAYRAGEHNAKFP